MNPEPIEILRAANPVMNDVSLNIDSLLERVMSRVDAEGGAPCSCPPAADLACF